MASWFSVSGPDTAFRSPKTGKLPYRVATHRTLNLQNSSCYLANCLQAPFFAQRLVICQPNVPVNPILAPTGMAFAK